MATKVEAPAEPTPVAEVPAPVDHQQAPSAHDSLNADQK